eukprot:365738-Chlamydomonas_euryale.AAC.12
MSAGCIPVVLGGGPMDPVVDGKNGYIAHSKAELKKLTLAVFAMSDSERIRIQEAVQSSLHGVSRENFEVCWMHAIMHWCQAPAFSFPGWFQGHDHTLLDSGLL